MTKNLLVIAGPTASGKTDIAIRLAKEFQCAVVSADSRQFYSEMQIGTARPLASELENIPHYFLGDRSIFDDFNVADYETEAVTKIEELHTDNDWVILTGGSGLYIDAVCNGIDETPEIPESYREQLNSEFTTTGILPLQEELKNRDPLLYQTIDLQNHRRLIRALEVCRFTNKPFSEFRSGKKTNRSFNIIKTALLWDRDVLYERINLRVDKMIASGLIEEAKVLFPNNHLNALHTVGYTELFQYFSGEISLDYAISLIKQNSRRYAKRQMTWFRRDNEYHWYEHSELDLLIDFAKKKGNS